MTLSRPLATKFDLVGGSNNSQELVTRLQAHWGGTSTRFANAAGVTTTAGTSLSVLPTDEAEPWQVNLRRTTTTSMTFTIDPEASITNAGNTGSTPTGASNKACPELAAFVLPSATANLRVWLLEWVDAFCLLCFDVGMGYFQAGVMVGKVYVPDMTGVPGQDGLGIFGGAPVISGWFGTSGGSLSRVRVGESGVPANDWLIPWGWAGTTSTHLRGGAYRLGTFFLCTGNYVGAGGAFPVGIAKYWFYTAVLRSGAVRLQDSTGEDFAIYTTSTSGSDRNVVPWPDGVDPTG